jgi:hypothetical protein
VKRSGDEKEKEGDEEEKRSLGPAYIHVGNGRDTASYGSIYKVGTGRR